MSPYPTLQDFDINEFESILPKVAFTKVTGILGKWFYRIEDFLKDFSPYIPLEKCVSSLLFHIVTPSYPGGHDLKKPKSSESLLAIPPHKFQLS